MKNKKGEIATLLTLGLVVVGTLITLGTSLFVSSRKTNLATNSRASTNVCTACNCGTLNGTFSNNPCYTRAGLYWKTPGCPGSNDLSDGFGHVCNELNTSSGSGGGATGDACSTAGGSCVSQSFSCTQVGGEPARSYCLSKAGQKCCSSSSSALPTQPPSGGAGGTTNADGSLIGSIGGCCFGYKQNTAAHTCASGQKYVRQYASASYMQTVADKPCTTAAYNSAYNAEWFDCAKIPNYTGTFNGDGCYPPAGTVDTTKAKLNEHCKLTAQSTSNGGYYGNCDVGLVCSDPSSSAGICVSMGICKDKFCNEYDSNLYPPSNTRKYSAYRNSSDDVIGNYIYLGTGCKQSDSTYFNSNDAGSGTDKLKNYCAGGGTVSSTPAVPTSASTQAQNTSQSSKTCTAARSTLTVNGKPVTVESDLYNQQPCNHVLVASTPDNIIVFRECPDILQFQGSNCVYSCFQNNKQYNCAGTFGNPQQDLHLYGNQAEITIFNKNVTQILVVKVASDPRGNGLSNVISETKISVGGFISGISDCSNIKGYVDLKLAHKVESSDVYAYDTIRVNCGAQAVISLNN